MGISQVNTEYIDFNVHLLVADLSPHFYPVLQNRGKPVSIMVANVGDRPSFSAYSWTPFVTGVGVESAIPIRALEICREGAHTHTHPLPHLFQQPLKGKKVWQRWLEEVLVATEILLHSTSGCYGKKR